MKKDPLIHFKEHKKPNRGFVLEIELNRPKKFNALSLEMILSLNKKLKEVRGRADLSALFIHSSSPKAFCAGGDVAQIREKAINGLLKGEDPALSVKDFFQKEYENNYILAHFEKPVILWGDGVVMGGGMGLFMSSSHPIATENSLFAMPENLIGFFPDVGAARFLSFSPGNLGLYVALTACRLNAREAKTLKLLRYALASKEKQNLLDFTISQSFKNREEFQKQFLKFYKEPKFLQSQNHWIADFKAEIASALQFKSLNELYNYLSQRELKSQKWEQNRSHFLNSSPFSLALTFEWFQRAKKYPDLKSLYSSELVMAMNMVLRGDFSEGVRALLVDKDKSPSWSPQNIENLLPEEIEQIFQAAKHWNTQLEV